MSFQTPLTVAEILQGIQTHDYVLPAIQREFEWSQEQIARIFDSLLRGYPIGSFLMWEVKKEQSGQFKWYGFIKDYHERNARHCPVLDLPAGRDVTAILDGQQRLTSLNIGLRGSHSQRLPGKWWKNPSSYPVQRLYLNLARPAPENEQGMEYELDFFAQPPAAEPANGIHWFPVHYILADEYNDTMRLFRYVQEHGLSENGRAFPTLEALRKVVHERPVINYYRETNTSIDRVLDIFIRVNSGGKVLGYSDLLMSIATAQWEMLDARNAVHALVDELNSIGTGFLFTKDVILKAGLVLTEVPDVGFKVTNFNHANMAKLEEHWEPLGQALRLAASLLADFGFSAVTLSASSVLVPIAYYVYKRGLSEPYRVASQHDADRAELRYWVVKSLIKPGIWGSGLDTLLRELRRVIAEHGAERFPRSELESSMAARGKSLSFTSDEIDDLVETPYGHKRAFPLLALLFPAINTRNHFHVDHVFPRSLFTRSRLRAAGLSEQEINDSMELVNLLPNLQLLEGQLNQEKLNKLPTAWLAEKYPDRAQREHYLNSQELQGLPESLQGFAAFYEARKQRLSQRLCDVLGVQTT